MTKKKPVSLSSFFYAIISALSNFSWAVGPEANQEEQQERPTVISVSHAGSIDEFVQRKTQLHYKNVDPFLL